MKKSAVILFLSLGLVLAQAQFAPACMGEMCCCAGMDGDSLPGPCRFALRSSSCDCKIESPANVNSTYAGNRIARSIEEGTSASAAAPSQLLQPHVDMGLPPSVLSDSHPNHEKHSINILISVLLL